jgi:MFS family permease
VTEHHVPALAEDEAGLPGPRVGEPIPTGGRDQLFKALAHREFRRLFGAYAIGDLGFWIAHISLQFEMNRITDGSTWLGILFFAMFIPALVFAPAAGVVADRFDRKNVLVISRSLISVVAAVLSALVFADIESPGMLVAFAFLIGSLFAFLAPSQQAIIANAVPTGDLGSAVSLQAAGNNVVRITGPALAAPILDLWGAGWAFAVYAVSNILMVALLLSIHVTRRREKASHLSFFQQFVEGLQHARERPPALEALTTMGVMSIFGIAYVALAPKFAEDVLGQGESSFTTLVVASGVGAVIGALGIGFRRRPPTILTAELAAAGFAAALIAFSLARSWPLALALNAVVGFCYFSATTAINTLIQNLADDDKRGRLLSLFNITWAGFVPLGGLWMGPVADALSAPTTVQIGAGVCLAYSLVVVLRPSTAVYSTAPPR